MGLAAQQCGVDVSLVFMDGVTTGVSTPGGRSDAVWGDTDDAFSQISWRKSRNEISGEGVFVDNNNFRKPTSWSTKRRDPPSKRGEALFLVNPRIVDHSPESEMRT